MNLLRANGSKIDVMLLDMTIPGASSNKVETAAAKARIGIIESLDTNATGFFDHIGKRH